LFCRNEQKLRRSFDVFQHRESACQIDYGTRRRIAMLLLVRDTLIVHDLPERVRIGRLCRGIAGQRPDQ
jgi:hypothetical protein